MKNVLLSLFVALFLVPSDVWAAVSCSRANLTRCLDSVCAINISSNPAARCQYCGTPSAGAPSATGMRGVSVGASAKYNISDKELKKAPTEPALRYSWAAEQCLKKVSGCTVDDVSDVYDSLIEQSCKAAGVAAEMKSLAADAAVVRSSGVCSSEVASCLVSDAHCGIDFANCESDADFNKHFSSCGVLSVGCDEYLGRIRDDLIAARDGAFENADKAIENIVAAYQNAREKLLVNTVNQCADGSLLDACVERVCASNMINGCATGFESERSMAASLCAFYKTACDSIK